MKIICTINHSKHDKNFPDKIPENPVFFMKPETALLKNGLPFFYPDFTENLHCDAELVLRIGKVGRSIPERFASRYIAEIGLGIDFTAGDIQAKCRAENLPWEICKSFDFSAPISPCFIPFNDFENVNNINFSLEINGQIVRKANSSDLMFSFDRIISYVSQFVTLKIGDLIFAGTTVGVETVKIGDNLKGCIENKPMLDFDIK